MKHNSKNINSLNVAKSLLEGEIMLSTTICCGIDGTSVNLYENRLQRLKTAATKLQETVNELSDD